jgi:hypothetical protein
MNHVQIYGAKFFYFRGCVSTHFAWLFYEIRIMNFLLVLVWTACVLMSPVLEFILLLLQDLFFSLISTAAQSHFGSRSQNPLHVLPFWVMDFVSTSDPFLWKLPCKDFHLSLATVPASYLVRSRSLSPVQIIAVYATFSFCSIWCLSA